MNTNELIKAYNTRGELIEFKLRESKSKYIGNTYTTNTGEKYKVLGNLNIQNNYKAYDRFLIEFEDSTKLVVRSSCIVVGGIKNPNAPSVYGIGYIGQGIYRSCYNSKYTKEYFVWHRMLQRCYSTKWHEMFSTYKGCTVDPRWYNYQNFCEDIQYLEGYKEWKENSKLLIYNLYRNTRSKIYSKDTCIFSTNIEMFSNVNITGKTYEATNIETGEKIIFCNQSKFAHKHNMKQPTICDCIKKKRKAHRGWTFREIE